MKASGRAEQKGKPRDETGTQQSHAGSGDLPTNELISNLTQCILHREQNASEYGSVETGTFRCTLLLLGSKAADAPLHHPNVPYFAHLFAAKMANALISEIENLDSKSQLQFQLEANFRITFVPEDILFSQFILGESLAAIVPTHTPETVSELEKFKGLLMLAPPRDPTRTGPRITMQRLIRIFDTRFREEENERGAESWRIQHAKGGEPQIDIVSPFWRRSIRNMAIEWGDFHSNPEKFPLGKNGLRRLIKDLESRLSGW